MASEAIRLLWIGAATGGSGDAPDGLPGPDETKLEIVRASCVEEALVAICATPFDVAAIELDAGGGEGLGHLRRLVGAAPSLPVVALVRAEEEGRAALRAGARHFHVRDAATDAASARFLRSIVAGIAAAPPGLPVSVTSLFHEIRTPLSVVAGFASLIRERAEETGDEEILAHLGPLERASQRILTTIGNVLDHARLEAGRHPQDPRPIALAPLVRDLVEEWLPAAAEKGLEVSCRIDEPHAAVRFDEYGLSHALANLVENALRYTTAGGVRVILFRNEAGDLQLDVRDTGRGIAPDRLEAIFAPYSGGVTEGAKGGSGLGLTVARMFVERNGATLLVRSQEGLGSCFTIRFPRALETGLPPADISVTSRSDRPRHSPSRDGVLLVEDDPDHRALVRWALEKRFVVFSAANADEARRHLEQSSRQIRIILMDLSLEGDETGFELTRSIRKRRRWRDIPIVAVTAHALDADRARALEAGCSEVLTKPFEPEALLDIIDRHLPKQPKDPPVKRRHLRLASSR